MFDAFFSNKVNFNKFHKFVNEIVKLSRHFLAVGPCTPGKVPADCKLAFQNCKNGSLNCTSFVYSETEPFHSVIYIYIYMTQLAIFVKMHVFYVL